MYFLPPMGDGTLLSAERPYVVALNMRRNPGCIAIVISYDDKLKKPRDFGIPDFETPRRGLQHISRYLYIKNTWNCRWSITIATSISENRDPTASSAASLSCCSLNTSSLRKVPFLYTGWMKSPLLPRTGAVFHLQQEPQRSLHGYQVPGYSPVPRHLSASGCSPACTNTRPAVGMDGELVLFDVLSAIDG